MFFKYYFLDVCCFLMRDNKGGDPREGDGGGTRRIRGMRNCNTLFKKKKETIFTKMGGNA